MAVALVAVASGTVFAGHLATPAAPPPPTVTAGPTINWPAQGQAAYTTSAINDLRASGHEQPVPIASVTKVMTAFVVLAEHPLEEGEDGPALTLTQADVTDTAQRQAGGESVVQIATGETLTEREALEALLLPSANNIAVVLSTFTSGSEPQFVELMNQTADELGLMDTHYADASGMSSNSVSTAVDQLILFDAAMLDPVFAAISGSITAELPVAGTVHNTNALLGTDGFVAGKTGSHDAAGGCLVFRVDTTIDGRHVTLTGAVLGQRDGPFIDAALTAAQQLASAALNSPDAEST